MTHWTRVARDLDLVRIDMTASNPLHTEPARPEAMPAPAAERVAVAQHPDPVAPMAQASSDTAEAEPTTPAWVELAAGRALRDEGAQAAVVTADPIDYPPVAPHDAHELREAEADAEAHAMAAAAPPGPMYRSVYSVVFTVVVGFFLGGAGLAVYVLVSH